MGSAIPFGFFSHRFLHRLQSSSAQSWRVVDRFGRWRGVGQSRAEKKTGPRGAGSLLPRPTSRRLSLRQLIEQTSWGGEIADGERLVDERRHVRDQVGVECADKCRPVYALPAFVDEEACRGR